MASSNLTLGMVAVSSAIFLLVAMLSTCHGKAFGSSDSKDIGGDKSNNNGLVKPVEFLRSTRSIGGGGGIGDYGPRVTSSAIKPEGENFGNDDDSSEERTNEIWNNVPWSYSRFPGVKFAEMNPWQSLSSSGVTFAQPPVMHKRYSMVEDGMIRRSEADGPRLHQQEDNQEGRLSNYVRNSGSSTTAGGNGVGVGVGGVASAAGFRYRPMNYNFRGFSGGAGAGSGGRLSGFLSSPISPRKRQILFRQCFFNPISCF